MARASAPGVTDLVTLSKDGGFSLPDEILAAHDQLNKLATLHLDPPAVLESDSAADRILVALGNGEKVDVLAVGRDIEASQAERRAYDYGQNALFRAREHAAEMANLIAMDLADRVIVDFLQPAFDALMEEARALAPKLDGITLTARDLLLADAPKIKAAATAYRKIEPLAVKRSLLVRARERCNLLGQRKPAQDHGGLFSLLRRPQALAPGWEPRNGAQLRLPTIPTDTVEALLWWATVATPAQPWLPTIAQQDQAWNEVFADQAKLASRAQNQNSRLLVT